MQDKEKEGKPILYIYSSRGGNAITHTTFHSAFSLKKMWDVFRSTFFKVDIA